MSPSCPGRLSAPVRARARRLLRALSCAPAYLSRWPAFLCVRMCPRAFAPMRLPLFARLSARGRVGVRQPLSVWMRLCFRARLLAFGIQSASA
eukprot:10433881-Lingulodinium_polyedra.AAC.1